MVQRSVRAGAPTSALQLHQETGTDGRTEKRQAKGLYEEPLFKLSPLKLSSQHFTSELSQTHTSTVNVLAYLEGL